MKYRYSQELPVDVEAKLDAYIERIKDIRWFKPDDSLQKSTVDAKVGAALSAFGVEASIEYRSLKTAKDYSVTRDVAKDAAWEAAWDAARITAMDVAMDAALDAAWGAARIAAMDAAWDAAIGAARSVVWDAARIAAMDAAIGAARITAMDAARGAQDVLASCTATYTGNMPFLKLIDIWELGVYPIGVVNGVFIVYSPKDFAEEVESKHVPKVIIDGMEYVPKN